MAVLPTNSAWARVQKVVKFVEKHMQRIRRLEVPKAPRRYRARPWTVQGARTLEEFSRGDKAKCKFLKLFPEESAAELGTVEFEAHDDYSLIPTSVSPLPVNTTILVFWAGSAYHYMTHDCDATD